MSKRRRKSKRTRTRPRRDSVPVEPVSSRRRTKTLVTGALVAITMLGAIGLAVLNRDSGLSTVEVKVPKLSGRAARGERAFETKCAQCHSINAGGGDNGPPLVHRIYEPSHHGDAAVRRAVRLGVRPHHWRFGPMPKVDVSSRELEGIIAYVRELQRANGIQ